MTLRGRNLASPRVRVERRAALIYIMITQHGTRRERERGDMANRFFTQVMIYSVAGARGRGQGVRN